MTSPSREPELLESLGAIVESFLSEVHTALPARIEQYAHPLADVKPVVPRVFLDKAGQEQLVEYPVVTDVPVFCLRGGGAFLHFPIAAGDLVLLVVAERSLDNWLETDGRQVVDHRDARRHNISDAVAFAGLWTTRDKAVVSDTDVVLGLKAGQKLLVGVADAAKALALAEQVDARLAAIEGWLPSHTHVSGGVGLPTATPLPVFAPGGGGDTTASTRLFADG